MSIQLKQKYYFCRNIWEKSYVLKKHFCDVQTLNSPKFNYKDRINECSFLIVAYTVNKQFLWCNKQAWEFCFFYSFVRGVWRCLEFVNSNKTHSCAFLLPCTRNPSLHLGNFIFLYSKVLPSYIFGNNSLFI